MINTHIVYHVHEEEMKLEIDVYNVNTNYWFKAVKITPETIKGVPVFQLDYLSNDGDSYCTSLCDTLQEIRNDLYLFFYSKLDLDFPKEYDELLESWILMRGMYL